ncbi:IS1 family transposase [Deinococcus alpinitundrae]|uniref:IS1 family transposase n=1 Tax=Deinococcus alpinitundrae TaxID=468913 RepID=UPI00192A259B|nr:IS1 family transposase [Deinococcus alpinitundrae]
MDSSSLDGFRCLNTACPAFGQAGLGNLRLRKWYDTRSGPRRLLRCASCGREFSELKGTALWNVKLPRERAANIMAHVTRGNRFKQTAELSQTHRTTVSRLVCIAGEHAQCVHDHHAQDLQVTSVQADERHSFVGRKDQPCWEATVIDSRSKFLVQNALGARTMDLAVRLLFGPCSRLYDPQSVVLFTDGWLPYDSLFAQVFDRPDQPKRQGSRGRLPRLQYRIPRMSGHVRIIKTYHSKRVTDIRIECAARSQRRIDQELDALGYITPNTSAVEGHNGTARRMNPHQVRRSLAFARLPHVRQTVSDLVNAVDNFCRIHRSLRVKLEEPVGRRQYAQRTPAMAIGIADSVWSVLRLLSTAIMPTPCRS